MYNYPFELLQDAHRRSHNNLMQVKGSTACCCFGCLHIFTSSDFPDGWLGDENLEKEQTVQCPFCGLDAVLGDASGFPVTVPGFVEVMNRTWFGRPIPQFTPNLD